MQTPMEDRIVEPDREGERPVTARGDATLSRLTIMLWILVAMTFVLAVTIWSLLLRDLP
jgi:hypothetical protein